jgi:alginate O-acetyltransferase complex protein AlgI
VLFNSYVFVAALLPLTLGGFAVACRFGRLPAAVFLLFASLVFYSWWNPRYLPLLAVSIGANYAASVLIMWCAARPRWQSAILMGAIAGNLAALFWCKYLAA